MRGYRGPNSVQRRNDAMFAMFERAKAQGHNSLHPESKKQIVKNKEKYESKKQERSEHKGAKTEALEKAKK